MSNFEVTLRHVAQGVVPLADGLRALERRASFDLRGNPAFVSYREPLDARVALEVEDVRRALRRTMRGEMSVDELSDWGRFVVMTSAYESPEPPADDEDFYDDLWDVLNDLAAPEVFGPITREWCEDALRRLARYSSTSSPRAG